MATVATASAEDIPRFNVSRYQVEGNSILTAADLERILKPFTGSGLDFGTLQQAIEALEDGYRSRGFHAVHVLLPEQELQGGVVRIVVTEVRIGAVTIEGNKHFSNANIRSSVPDLQEGTIPNLDRISMNTRVANENPARKTQVQLLTGQSDEKVDALLKVADEKPWQIGVSIDNTGNSQSGKTRLSVLLQHANLFDLDHLATFQYTTSPDHPENVTIFSLGYHIPFYSLGDSLDLYGGYSDVNSGTVQSGILSLNVSGKGKYAGFRYNQNLTRIGAYEHRVLYGFDYRRFDNDISYAGVPLGSTTEDLPISLGYSGNRAFEGGHELSGWGTVSQNIAGANYGNSADYEKVRAGATSGFTILRAGGSAMGRTANDFQLRLSVNGQYSWNPLIPGEQFGLGGISGSLRGFSEREIADDSGIGGSVELYTPNLFESIKSPPSQLRALVFYDLGYLSRNNAQPGEASHRDAASTGAGFRFAVDRHLTISTDYGYVVNPESARTAGSSRWHFKVSMIF